MFLGPQRLWKPGVQKWKVTTILMQDFVPVDMPTIQHVVGSFNRLCDAVIKKHALPIEAVSSLRHENKFMVQNGEDQLYLEIEDLGLPSLAEMQE